MLAGLVIVAFLAAVLALATASTAALALLVIALVTLMAISIGRHLRHTVDRGRSAAT